MKHPMRPPDIPLEKVRALGPVCLSMTVPDSYADQNGHMNMRWYLAIFDDAGEALHARLGLTPEYHQAHGTGTFDLEHHIHFLREVMPRDVVTVYARLVAHSAKRLHYLLFLIDETKDRLAATFECMNAFAALAARGTAPWPPEISARIAADVDFNNELDWPAPVCGAMQV
jgi:acyl-CoA thioester hydrolase